MGAAEITGLHTFPTHFISSRKYYCHAANLEYQELNFAHPNYHELYL